MTTLSVLEEHIRAQIRSAGMDTPTKVLMERIFLPVKETLELLTELCYTMPEGFEQAYGVTDPITGDIHVNEALWADSDPVAPLFYFLHELRHAMQTAHPEWFSRAVQLNARYILQYDGTAYKLEHHEILEVKLSGEQAYFTELYLASPAEMDANAFTYRCLSGVGGQKLEALYAMWLPRYTYFSPENAEAEFLKAVREIEIKLT